MGLELLWNLTGSTDAEQLDKFQSDDTMILRNNVAAQDKTC